MSSSGGAVEYNLTQPYSTLLNLTQPNSTQRDLGRMVL